jgi:hypothetical protein
MRNAVQSFKVNSVSGEPGTLWEQRGVGLQHDESEIR